METNNTSNLNKSDVFGRLEEARNHCEGTDAFDRAIAQGRLSDNPQDNNYAGNYMYMGREQKGDIGKDLFKNINTRQYDV